MNSRLEQFLNAENLTQADFADTLGVARASVSHIVSGRNKPGFDFLEKLARFYPSLNLEWFITGRGRMYKNATLQAESAEIQSNSVAEPSVFDTVEEVGLFDGDEELDSVPSPAPLRRETKSNTLDRSNKAIDNKKSISKVLVFYNDGTFEELVK